MASMISPVCRQQQQQQQPISDLVIYAQQCVPCPRPRSTEHPPPLPAAYNACPGTHSRTIARMEGEVEGDGGQESPTGLGVNVSCRP
eukprot:1158203-Pelagomonas_calceolata.AAC.3